MPSAEETTYLIEVMPDAGINQDSFTSRDVDVLVSRIKENLRLSSLKSRSSLAHKMRPSPYALPSRSWSDPSTCKLCSMRNGSNSDPESRQQPSRCRHCRKVAWVRSEPDDSYDRFQALLRNGALIKEAVKRLQTCPEDNDDEEEEDEGVEKRRATSTSATSTTLDSMDDEEEEDEVVQDDEHHHHFFYRRKRFYYNSEDEPLPPCYQPLDL